MAPPSEPSAHAAMPVDPSVEALVCRSVPVLLGLATLLLALGVLTPFTGWKFLQPYGVIIRPNTVLAYTLLTAALGLRCQGKSWARVAASGGAVLALAVAAATLSQDLFGWDLGIDLWLGPDPNTYGSGVPGRMAPATAFSVVALALANLRLDSGSGQERHWPRFQWFCTLVFALNTVPVLGYIYASPTLYKLGGNTAIPLYSSALSWTLALATLHSRPRAGLMRLLTSQTVAGLAARRLLPKLLVAVIALGFVPIYGHRSGCYSFELGVAAMVIAIALVLVGVSVFQLRSLAELEVARAQLSHNLAETIARQRQEARTRAIYTSLQDAIVTVDERHEIIDLNSSAETLFGHPAHTAIGLPFNRLVGERQRSRVSQELHRVLRSPGSGKINWDSPGPQGHAQELGMLRRDGQEIHCEISLNSWRAGDRIFCTAVVRDISERKRREWAMRRLYQIIEVCRDGIGWASVDGHLLFLNRAARAMWGLSPDQSLDGLRLRDFRPERLQQRIEEEYLPQAREQGLWSGYTHLTDRSGSEFPVAQDLMFLRSEEGEEYISTVFRDIREQQQREEKLAQASYEAEAANRAKSEFLATMSHELRTPLNAIIGFSQVLSEQTFGELNAKQTRYARNILKSGTHLLDVINDILDLSKIEAGKMELNLTSVSLATVIQESLDVVREQAAGKKHQIEATLPEPQLMVFADPVRYQQVLVNLLTNAIKYTPDGGKIRLEHRVSEGCLEVSIQDTGVGVRGEDQQRIFQKFEQADNSYSRAQEGTGLGLALSREIMRLHGGDIRVDSAGENTGSTFTTSLPVAG